VKSTALLYLIATVLICSSVWALLQLAWLTSGITAYAEDAVRDQRGDPVQIAEAANSYFGARAKSTLVAFAVVNAVSGIAVFVVAAALGRSRKIPGSSAR
jgi:hypothetical protein